MAKQQGTSRKVSKPAAGGRPPSSRGRNGGSGPRRPPPRRRGPWGRVLSWGATLGIWLAVALAGVLAYFAYDLPDVDRLHQVERNPSVTLVSTDGIALATVGDLYGDFVPLRQLPDTLIGAVLATEDRRFFSHFGLDVFGLARASLANLRAGRVVQGGSTVTQQLAKNVFLTPDRTLKRKVQELLLALWLERQYSKEDILSIYLNRVYFGAGAYGIDAAAKRYFDKSARQLDLAESAMLAGLLKAPSRFAPTANLTGARQRASQVLANMVDAGYLDPAAVERARANPAAPVAPRQPVRNARYFADWVLDSVYDYAGRAWPDLVVVTTLDMRLQAAAETALERVLAAQGGQRDAAQAALVALDSHGAVRAMVGGRDYRASAFNRATQALRQPGSAFKTFVYLAGLEAGTITPESRLRDAPVAVGDWQPRNLDNRYFGEVTVRDAFARSLNTVAVQISERTGRSKVVEMAQRLGITTELAPHPSVALGAGEVTLLEMTGAYGAVATGGIGMLPHGILEIRTPDGGVIYRRKGGGPGRVLSPRVAAEMTGLLAAVVEGGTGRAARLERPAAGKTGTSQDFRDAWFVGFTADMVAGVWVGNDAGGAMNKVTGGQLPAQIWKGFMTAALAGTRPEPLVVQHDEGPLRSLWDRIVAEFGGGRGEAAPDRQRQPPTRATAPARPLYSPSTDPAPGADYGSSE